MNLANRMYNLAMKNQHRIIPEELLLDIREKASIGKTSVIYDVFEGARLYKLAHEHKSDLIDNGFIVECNKDILLNEEIIIDWSRRNRKDDRYE